MGGRQLLDFADKARSGRQDCFIGDSVQIITGIDFGFQIIGWGRGSQCNSPGIFFFLRLVLIDLFGEFTGT